MVLLFNDSCIIIYDKSIFVDKRIFTILYFHYTNVKARVLKFFRCYEKLKFMKKIQGPRIFISELIFKQALSALSILIVVYGESKMNRQFKNNIVDNFSTFCYRHSNYLA